MNRRKVEDNLKGKANIFEFNMLCLGRHGMEDHCLKVRLKIISVSLLRMDHWADGREPPFSKLTP